ncbi:hypothetical protein [Nocardioides gilvus]|uniref:hypothetical protein n=1 Tax=Nocardioides gilvus TaxID=1735589 RepID=UPI000D7478C1|nr:hypothetical protein [Nocardioides gilvus]
MLAADATDLDALADALRVDGVVIDRVMGSGEAQESHDRIAALIREVPFPVYVALVRTPDGVTGEGHRSSESMAALLHRRLGGKGLYVVATTSGTPVIVSYGLGADPALLSLSASSNEELIEQEAERRGVRLSLPDVVEAEAHTLEAEALVAEAQEHNEAGYYPSTLDEEEVRALAERSVAVFERAEWRPRSEKFVDVRTASTGFSVLVGGVVGLVVALLLGQSLRGWPRHASQVASRGTSKSKSRGLSAASPRTPPVDPPPAPPAPGTPVLSTERARATTLVGALAKQLSRVDLQRADADLVTTATTARTAAEHLLDSEDVADLVGAQVLARTGSRDLERARRGGKEAYRPCFFDPRHGEASGRIGWRLGQGQVEVPCCRRCSADVTAGREPEVLRLKGRRGPRPYWDRQDVWARTGFGAVSDSLAAEVLRERESR